MDGNYLRQAIKDWLQTNLINITKTKYASVHIDDLLHARLHNPEMFEISLVAFKTLISEVHSLGNPVKSFLCVPLISTSKKIRTRIPFDLNGLFRELSDTPPGLYIIPWEMPKTDAIVEEYKCPLKFQLIQDFPYPINVYYREHRYASDIMNNWEFSRNIYAEYLPDGLLER